MSSNGRRRRRDRGQMVPEAEFRSYYGRPIIKEPAWTIEVPWYFFTGGMAGASAPFAVAARLTGNHPLARGALTVAACPCSSPTWGGPSGSTTCCGCSSRPRR
jgi:hypothetical protein